MTTKTTKDKKVAKKSGIHPKHPPCPDCGKSLYKAMVPKATKKSDPWAFCRNPYCDLFGVDQSGKARDVLKLKRLVKK